MSLKKLSEIKGRQATELLGQLLIDVGDMMADAENQKAYKEKGAIGLVGSALIRTPDAVVNLLARLNEVPVEKYDYSAVSLARDAFSIFRDPEMIELFGSQG